MFWKKAVVAIATFLAVSSFIVLTPIVATIVVVGLTVWTLARLYLGSQFDTKH
jgi:hypothetical protein